MLSVSLPPVAQLLAFLTSGSGQSCGVQALYLQHIPLQHDIQVLSYQRDPHMASPLKEMMHICDLAGGNAAHPQTLPEKAQGHIRPCYTSRRGDVPRPQNPHTRYGAHEVICSKGEEPQCRSTLPMA